MTEPLTISIVDKVSVDGDDFFIQMTLTRPVDPARHRDMETIKAEIERLLPSWVKTKIQAGET